jgi:hypothetical protein
MVTAAKKVRGPGKRPNRLSDEATRAKRRAKAIFDEYVQAHNGIAPKTSDLCECLAREGLARSSALIGRWRNDGAWDEALRPAIQPVLQHYEIAAHDVTYEAHPGPVETYALGAEHRRVHLKARQLFENWLDGADPAKLTTQEAFRLLELLGADRTTAETCDIRLRQFKIMAARELSEVGGRINEDGRLIEHHNIVAPGASDELMEKSRMVLAQAEALAEGKPYKAPDVGPSPSMVEPKRAAR